MLTRCLLVLATLGLSSADPDHNYLAAVQGHETEPSYEVCFNFLKKYTDSLEKCAVATYVIIDLASYTAVSLGVPITSTSEDTHTFLHQLGDELSVEVRRGFYAKAVAFVEKIRRCLWEEGRRLGLRIKQGK